MTSQNITDNQSTGDAIYFNSSVFGKLAGMNRTSPYAPQVMLTLMAMMDRKGAVSTTQGAIAHRCKILVQEVEQAINDLASADLILSVEASPEPPGGSLTCLVNPDFVRGEMPGNQVQPFLKLHGRELADG
ncbi:hypothetical protein ACIPO9_12805 [Pseudomonas sp. NPDC090203]|uniref:hypothetical protein n=1 Tax=Pseudomonas sp. NPDC090203 TaxID=3364477 RepID=UPI00382F7C51